LSRKLKPQPNIRRQGKQGERLDVPAPGVEYGALDNLVGYAIRRAQMRIYQDFLDSLGPSAITPPRFSAMTIIECNAGMKLTELANAMGIARSGAVEVVNSLEKLGYVSRTDSATDRRAFALVLTDDGRQALQQITVAVKEHDMRISTRLTPREKSELRRLLDMLG
jgi:DNA-binding MarR family transcriptional regulator